MVFSTYLYILYYDIYTYSPRVLVIFHIKYEFYKYETRKYKFTSLKKSDEKIVIVMVCNKTKTKIEF